MRTLSSRSLHIQKVTGLDLKKLNELRKLQGAKPLRSAEVFNGSALAWLIIDRITQDAIGAIYVEESENDSAHEIGFVMRPEFRNKGILSAILPSFVKCLGIPLVQKVATENPACVRVLEKSGFEKRADGYRYLPPALSKVC